MAGVKRVLDVLAAGFALLLLSPLLAVAAIAIWITMGTPIVFRQERAGRHGKPFELLKLRTMRAPSIDEVGSAHDMARTTRVGALLRRTSIDEIPSLLNVLRGEMSIVGPRPLPMAYVPRYTAEQARRLSVLPGLTGWAVVHGRNQIGWDERFDLDVWYVNHRSFPLDLRIILRTVVMVFRGSNVNHSTQITMPEFRGNGPSGAVPSDRA